MAEPNDGTALTGLTRDIADRLADFALRTASGDGPDRPHLHHDRLGLANGHPGMALALLCAGRALDDSGLLDGARAVLRSAAAGTAQRPYSGPGLYTGTAGFASVLLAFAEHDERYLPSLRRVADSFGEQVAATRRPAPGTGLPFTAYDVVEGASGQLAAAVRLATVVGAPEGSPLRTAIDELVDYLDAVTAADGQQRFGWLMTPAHYPPAFPWYAERAPHGMYNLGFAHGLPGILGAFTAAAAAGYGGSRVTGKVADLAEWLVLHRTADPDPRAGWAVCLQAEEHTLRPVHDPAEEPSRAAWCYGAPGIGTGLLAAAAVLDDADLRETAIGALRRVLDTDPAYRHVFAPTLCHGHAGMAAVYRRAHAETGVEEFRDMADRSLAAVVGLADPDRPFLVADEPEAGQRVDDPGFLTGAAGTLLALSAAVRPEVADWDELLFLTPARSGERTAAR
ncbi:lanthionine synthetase LanC family protein [Kitasatospora sp. NPDC048545]|uniref:lanthionine synthetase LanC family protein n=1 Tax=Kitasatospora sp. NPDC048545 TaxID=3157208 RepID=UPI0033CB5ED1